MDSFAFAEKTVLITGASMGLGEVFARQLAASGARLILVARSEARLQALAAELGNATVVAMDLQQPGAAERLFSIVERQGLRVDVLINNAGFGRYGLFGELERQEVRGQVDLNVGALVELTHLFMPMLEQRAGGVIQVASLAAFQPCPYLAVYAATKAFVLQFSEALWAEYRPRGVRVLALCPGVTDTAFFERSGELAALGPKADPHAVVRLGLRAFQAGRCSTVHGFFNRFLTLGVRVLPRWLMAWFGAALLRPRASS